jgi:hypothetical protein
VFLVALLPHVVWLVREDFPPITWVATRRVSASFGETLTSIVETFAGTLGYATAALALVLLFVRPRPAALADGFFPRDERRTASILFWVPLLLPIVPALIKNINLLSLWNTPALNLLPVMLLGSPLVTLPRAAVLRIAGIVTALTLLIVAASPLVAFTLLKTGVENAKSRPVTPVYSQVSQAIYKNVNDALSGQTDPQSALKKAQSDMDKALSTF